MQASEQVHATATLAAWARELYGQAVDHKDAAGFAAVFTEDASLRFGNAEPIAGRAGIEAAIAHFFTAFVALRHQFDAIVSSGSTLFLQATVTYTRHDGALVTVPAMTVFEMVATSDVPLARRCQIYVDLTPLFAPQP